MISSSDQAGALGVGEADHAIAAFVPQGEVRAGEALAEGDRVDVTQLGDGIEAGVQAVVGDAALEVVDVMEADVTGAPVQPAGEGVSELP